MVLCRVARVLVLDVGCAPLLRFLVEELLLLLLAPTSSISTSMSVFTFMPLDRRESRKLPFEALLLLRPLPPCALT